MDDDTSEGEEFKSISNDIADYVVVKCQLCGEHKPMTSLRAHTKSAHKVTITEYKSMFGTQLIPMEVIMHRCGICAELVLLDSDHIAVHLKTPGHNISHKDYNACYMQDTRVATKRRVANYVNYVEKDMKKEMNEGITDNKENTSLFPIFNQNIVKQEMKECDTKIRTKRIRREVISFFDYDEELAYEKAMKESLKELKHDLDFSLEDPSSIRQLQMSCSVSMQKIKLSEEEISNGFIIVEKKEVDYLRHEDVKLESVVASDMIKQDVEVVEKNITRYSVGGRIIKQCNICPYSTDRNDKTTMLEHLFSHFPDICGFACIVCRKTEKRKKNLMRHLEAAHSKQWLQLLGISDLQLYEEQFSSNSDEQTNLRAEAYCQIRCDNCGQMFFSTERMAMHEVLGQCKPGEGEINIKKEKKQKVHKKTYIREELKYDFLDDYDESDFHPYNSLETQYSDSEDDDFIPNTSRGNFGQQLFEQTSISASYPGLMECLSGGAPYCCVVPSCNKRPYPTMSSIRRHLTTHDPDMYAYLICPICKYVRPDDHPGDMRKHVTSKHGKDEDWAKENVIVDISEKLQKFRRDTTKDSGQKGNGSFIPFLSKVPISLDDPAIRTSFTGEKGSHTFLVCGVSDCGKKFKSAYNLKRHYSKHDDTLRNKFYECNLCPAESYKLDGIKSHVENTHPEVLFLLESGEDQWTLVKCERWEEFSGQSTALIDGSQYVKKESEEEDEEDYEIVHLVCNYCSVAFNTRNAYMDHRKIHQSDLIGYTCKDCQEGFIVERVFKNHVRGHKKPYTSMKFGSIRCNGCSQYFKKKAEVKTHLKHFHVNLLNNCLFCEVCGDFFMNKKYLEKHMFSHAKQVYKCPVCNKKFLTEDDASIHISKNTCTAPVKSYTCPYGCGRNLKQADLSQHKIHCQPKEEDIFTWDRDTDL